MAENTYTVTLGTNTPFSGTDEEDAAPLVDFGYTDEEWDTLTEQEKETLTDRWAQEYLHERFSAYGRVDK
jgi:hypothetical protein